jgi:diguanylate cyclase (GGDEF)-like protein/PAS domain S-box-containing protein
MGEINGSNESGDGGLAGPSAPTGRLDGRSGIEDDGRRSAEVTSRGYVAALDAAGEGVLFTDSEERIVDINRAFTEITGYAAVDVCGSTPRILASGRHDRPFWGSVWNAVRTTGCWKGEVWNRRKDGEVFPVLLRMGEVRDGAGVVSGYFGVLSDLTAVKESEERFERLAHHDALTHLPNRLLLRVRVDHAAAQARRGGRRMAIIVLGLDGFQAVNDSLGYVAGDEFLRGVAARLVSSVRAEATVARISGDEFAILLEDVSDSQDAGSEARNVLQSVARPLAVRGKEILLTGSAGISVFPEDGRDFDTLLRHADAALHRAKETGRNTAEFYTAELTRKATERFAVEAEIREAFRRKEFVLHFQPQISMTTGAVVGVEALARWQHPRRGLLLPKEFIPVAEETGLIEQFGSWALGATCAQARLWQDAGLPPFKVAVNISPREIPRPELAGNVAAALKASGLEPGRLELEITEGFLLARPNEALGTLMSLKALGVTLAIDDFGTGYSSLSHLKNLPVDRLKIDQSFVDDIALNPDDEAIVRAIITLGRGLNLRVIAEGVETEEQADFLRRHRCDEIQGFLFSRALPPDDLARYVQERT